MTLATAFGVVVHDTQLDHAIKFAVLMPATVIAASGVDYGVRPSDPHTHAEKVSAPKFSKAMRTPNPRVAPRDDEKKYQLNRRVCVVGGDGSISLWPSS
ncbi:hypothetical protein B7Z00_04335 [Candidatus Saccharibacteria bacterium 32-50-10]|nr:MAG: hypothetical protein B7Z00_04335 [Candidatus Saccharibacteria bacterium 32-50-10]